MHLIRKKRNSFYKNPSGRNRRTFFPSVIQVFVSTNIPKLELNPVHAQLTFMVLSI